MNILQTIKLYILSKWIVYYVNITVNLLQKMQWYSTYEFIKHNWFFVLDT